MKTLLSFCAMFLMVATLGFAADIDGKWVEERKFTPPNGGEERTITTTFELKAAGATLTGKITTSGMGPEPRTAEIKEGKIDGSNFSFKVTMTTQRGESTTLYTGTVAGNELKGKREREGGGGGGRMGSGEFVAKKQ